jgi:transglutaminase-like putative cysteine protease
MKAQDDRLTIDTDLFDYEHPAVAAFVEEAGCREAPDLTTAVGLLHDAVRDTIDYNVFNVPLHERLSASEVAEYGSGFCLHKSLLFVAGCRRLGVPAVLCSDVVTNHVADEAMLELVGGEEFLHWYTQIRLAGRWIKAAPIFNALLCSVYGLEVLRFDPDADSIEQANGDGSTMRYRQTERRYPDPGMAELLSAVQEKHPRMVTGSGRTPTPRILRRASTAEDRGGRDVAR